MASAASSSPPLPRTRLGQRGAREGPVGRDRASACQTSLHEACDVAAPGTAGATEAPCWPGTLPHCSGLSGPLCRVGTQPSPREACGVGARRRAHGCDSPPPPATHSACLPHPGRGQPWSLLSTGARSSPPLLAARAQGHAEATSLVCMGGATPGTPGITPLWGKGTAWSQPPHSTDHPDPSGRSTAPRPPWPQQGLLGLRVGWSRA